MVKASVGTVELRKVFSNTLRDLMEQDPRVVYLEADLAGAIGTSALFAERPEQAFDLGIMEANMVGVAAGMSIRGNIPFVHSFGTFATRRCADQTFLSGCYNRANVTIIGSDPGITAEANGGTHMPLEDMAVYRAFPEMRIFDVAEPHLLEFVLRETASQYGMAYIRFPRKWKQVYYSPDETFTAGKGKCLTSGKDVTIIASGVEVYEALKAAEMLQEQGISAEVLDIFTVKPLDRELILDSVKKTGRAVTAENHNVIGGLGSAVAELLIEEAPVPLRRVGVRDHFGEVGSFSYLSERFGLSAQAIAEAAQQVVKQNP